MRLRPLFRAAAVGGGVFALAALFHMELRQALLLAAMAGAAAWGLELARGPQ